MIGCRLVDVDNQVLCKYFLKEADLTKLRDAIEDLYYFEFVIGEIVYCLLCYDNHLFLCLFALSITQVLDGVG